MKLASGENVVNRPNKHIHEEVEKYLAEAIGKISSGNKKFIVEEVVFDNIIGDTICVETSDSDQIVWAMRPKRYGFTRFVKNRKPKPCSSMVIILLKAEEPNKYVIISSFIGKIAEPEPWDIPAFNSKPDPYEAGERSRAFWNTHALIWGYEKIVPGTETNVCPW